MLSSKLASAPSHRISKQLRTGFLIYGHLTILKWNWNFLTNIWTHRPLTPCPIALEDTDCWGKACMCSDVQPGWNHSAGALMACINISRWCMRWRVWSFGATIKYWYYHLLSTCKLFYILLVPPREILWYIFGARSCRSRMKRKTNKRETNSFMRWSLSASAIGPFSWWWRRHWPRDWDLSFRSNGKRYPMDRRWVGRRNMQKRSTWAFHRNFTGKVLGASRIYREIKMLSGR